MYEYQTIHQTIPTKSNIDYKNYMSVGRYFRNTQSIEGVVKRARKICIGKGDDRVVTMKITRNMRK